MCEKARCIIRGNTYKLRICQVKTGGEEAGEDAIFV